MAAPRRVLIAFTPEQLREFERFLAREDLPVEHWKLADDLKELVDAGVTALTEAELRTDGPIH